MQAYKPIRSTGAAVAVIRLSYVAVVGSLKIWVDSYSPPDDSAEPFLVHTTVVAGDPVEVQLRVSAESAPETSWRDVTLGSAAGVQNNNSYSERWQELGKFA